MIKTMIEQYKDPQVIKRLWFGFWQLADPKIWTASTIPMLFGAILAYTTTGSFSGLWFVIALAAAYLIEIGKNAVNEVVDFDSGVDTYVTPDKKTDFSGGKKVIVEGKLSTLETKIIAVLTLLGACGIGLLIMIFREPHIFWIGFTGVLLSIFYTMPPFKLSYNGLGEAAVGITFGPLMVAGMYLVLAGTLDWTVLVSGIPLAFLISNVLWINQYPDYEADLRGNKRNGLVRIGKEAGIKVYKGLFVANYVSIIILAWVLNNPYMLIGLATIPIAVQAVRTAQKYMYDIPKLVAANAKTLIIYLLTGVCMIVALLIHYFF